MWQILCALTVRSGSGWRGSRSGLRLILGATRRHGEEEGSPLVEKIGPRTATHRGHSFPDDAETKPGAVDATLRFLVSAKTAFEQPGSLGLGNPQAVVAYFDHRLGPSVSAGDVTAARISTHRFSFRGSEYL